MLTCRRIVNRKFIFISWPESISFGSLPSLDPLPQPPPLHAPLALLPCSIPSLLLLSLLPCIAILGTVDFVLPDGKCFFRTCDRERDKVIFQMVRQDLPPPSLFAVSLNLAPRLSVALCITKAGEELALSPGSLLKNSEMRELFSRMLPGSFLNIRLSPPPPIFVERTWG